MLLITLSFAYYISIMTDQTLTDESSLREHLVKLLEWGDAHVDFNHSIDGIPSGLQGVRPEGLPYSAWELLEHLRLTQSDILNFCRNPNYQAPKWPDQYWPQSTMPPRAESWQESVDSYLADRLEMQKLAADASLNLLAKIPHGEGQTLLREVLLLSDHNAYHVGEIIAVRRALGIWK